MMFQPAHDINWIDQSGHLIAGAMIVGLSLALVPWYWAVLISLVAAVGREQWQHPLACHAGCRTDLLFWTLGSLAASALSLFV